MKGWVYILKNPALDGMYKIGFTNRDPLERVSELSNTSIPYEFKILYAALVEDPETVEKTLHGLLETYRVSSNREFFNAPIDKIHDTLQCALNSLGLKVLFEENKIQDEVRSSSHVITIGDILEYKQSIIDAYSRKIDNGFDNENSYYVEFLKKNQLNFLSRLDEILSDNVMSSWLHSINSHIQIADGESSEWARDYMKQLIHPQISPLLREYDVEVD